MPWHVDALPETRDGEQARFGAVAKLLDDALARARPLNQDLGLQSGRHRVGDAIHHRTIGEEREGPSAGRADEFDQLFDDRLFGAGVVATGEVLRHVKK